MADNKNQHFVPRCHLKPFTADQTNKAIHLFNLDLDRVIYGAPVKNQCSRDYFYGQDARLESAIQRVESLYGETLQRLRIEGAVLTAVDHLALRRFMLLQHLRTEAASVRSSQIVAALAELPGVVEEGETFDIKAEIREAVLGAMRYYARSKKVVDDLNLVIIRNRSRTPFVTSDDPAVLTNRWYLQNPRARGLAFGVRSSGTLLLLPLSPDQLALLYDRDVYVIHNRQGVLEIDRDDDAKALNDHQILNCAANIYFAGWERREAVATFVRGVAVRRPEPRHRTTYAVTDEQIGEYVRYAVRPLADIRPVPERDVLVHVETLRPKPERWPRFLEFRRGGQAFSNGSRTGFVRLGCLQDGFVQGEGYRRFWL